MTAINGRRSKRLSSEPSSQSDNAFFEVLEPRQLLSCVIDTRLAGGGKAIQVSSVGQVVQMQVWAIITGKDASGANDGFQSVAGSFLSTSSSSTSVLGSLSSTVLDPFTASGAQNGQQADLDSDGDLDIGSNDPNNFPPYYNARSGSGANTTSGVVSGASHSFEIATLTFTVTNLKSGQASNINFRERGDDSFTGGALWSEDGNFTDSQTGSYSVGASVVITAAGVVQQNGGSINGEVYNDTNKNGALNSGETGITGVVVYIDANNDGAFDGTDTKTTTDTSGNYSLTGLAAGNYIVRQQVPSGDKQTAPSGGLGQHVTVTANKASSGVNFGDSGGTVTPPPPPGQNILGEVYNDANKNGALNAGETGLGGVTVYLDNNNNGAKDASEQSAVTDASGLYTIANVTTGAKVVREIVPAGFKQTQPSGGLGQHVTVSSGKNSTGVNFGDASTTVTPPPTTGTVTGEVFKDVNGNGKIDSGDTGINNVTVYLDLNNDGVNESNEPKAVTNSSGVYTFMSVAAGNYIARQVKPSGFTQSAPSGGLGAHISVAAGKTTSGVNFGDKPTNGASVATNSALFSQAAILPSSDIDDLLLMV